VEGAGVKVLGGPADSGKSFNWQGQEDPKLALDPEVSAVVVGLDREVNYYKLQHAMAYITKQKAMFVVGAAATLLCVLDLSAHSSN
jgi:ribonucleotide monophosphatase NagD (HAD superfamily)